MRVIHTVPAISEEASGPSYSVVRLCESLMKEGHEVTLSVLDWAPPPSPYRFVKAFPLGIGPRRLGRSPEMYRWLTQQAISRSVEILHNHSLWMMPNVYPGIVARRHHVPLVISPRGTLSKWARESGSVLKRFFWPLVQKPALSAIVCFHATAESECEDIRRMGFRQPVAIIPNGIDIPEPAPKRESPCRTLLFLGRIHPKKGLDMLLPAWKAVQNRFTMWRLVIAGPDNDGYLAQMQDLAVQLDLKRIEFVGALKGAQKWDAYQQADLFVLPTYSENFAMTVAEALAAGMPAIVSKGAPWAQLIEKQSGWWIEIGIEPLVDCLHQALTRSSPELEAMGQHGRAWMQAEFSWHRIGGMMAQTYAWIVQGGKPPAWVRWG